MSVVIKLKEAARRLAYQCVGRGVYKDPRTGNFYERPVLNGARTWRKLEARTVRLAIDEAAENRVNLRLSLKVRPLAENPYARNQAATIGELCALYVKSGCPKKRSASPRSPRSLKQEAAMVATLREFFGDRPADEFGAAAVDEFFEWRRRRIKKQNCSGARAIDRELAALSNVFRFAVDRSRQTGLEENPLEHGRRSFVDPDLVRHCRDFQPASGDELHALARFLFSSKRSEVLGWQLLLEAMIGSRSHEICKLRRDAAADYQAGYIRDGVLFLWRSNTQKGTYAFAQIHPALALCLTAHRRWLDRRFPRSPWFLPSPEDPRRPVTPGALTKALRERVAPAIGLPKRTSHGLRSFFVNVLRAQGVPDAEIALRIGHRSGGRLIVTTYGEKTPGALDWMPVQDAPAWSILAPPPQLEFGF